MRGGKATFFSYRVTKKKLQHHHKNMMRLTEKCIEFSFSSVLNFYFFFVFNASHTFQKYMRYTRYFWKKNIWYNSYTLAWFVYLLERHHIQNYVKSLMMLCNKIGFRHNFKILLMSLRQVEKSTHFRKIYEAMYFISCEKSYA